MAIWNEKFYKGTDVYSDGTIEDEILDIVCREDYKEQKDNLIGNNYTIAYHLSPIRENILNWYPFLKDESAIEIGAGCGAITGMLCRKLGKVVSVDLSKRRSMINYERHKKYENLEIVVGNFNDMEFEEQYDYVVLNGVFEYAISFTDSEKPYHDFLRHISRFLKPNGKFLISIENKLGLKYFNGAKEDHTGNYFLGLNDYTGNETVRTFSKTELEEILADEGFEHTKFYYPYPDYKFPNEVFTEETMVSNQYGRPFINIEDDRYFLFDEDAVGKTLLKENVRNIFANSFLVEACKEDFQPQVIYAKLNVERKPEFQIGTSIVEKNDEKSVVKYAIHPSAKAHIEKIYDTTRTVGKKVNYLSAKKTNDGINFEFLCNSNLDSCIVELLEQKNKDEIVSVIKSFFEAYFEEFAVNQKSATFYDDTFRMYFGKETSEKEFICVKDANIDVIMDNIYKIEQQYLLIDGEWVYPGWIPYAFVKWRAINELYSKHVELSNLIPRNEMLEKTGIDVKDEKLFFSWAIYFANTYVGSYQRGRWAKLIESISLDEIHQEVRSLKFANMSLYMDFGEGFTEEGKLYQDVDISKDEFEITFTSEDLKRAKNLRFDPIEGQVCVANIKCISDGFVVENDNSCEELERGKLFVNLDPQFYIRVATEVESITIKAIFKIIQKADLVKCLQEINDKRLMLGAHVVNVEKRMQEVFEELGNTSYHLEVTKGALHNTASELEVTKGELCNTTNELDVCKDTIVAQREKRERLSIELEAKILEKEAIIEALMRENNEVINQRDYFEAENEKHAFLANSTKAFVKRKIKLKLAKFLERK